MTGGRARPRCWIFDLDGTLTEPVFDFDRIRRLLDLPAGTPILEAIARQPAAVRRELSARLEAIELDTAARARAQPGARAILIELRRRRMRFGIVTRNAADSTWATLRGAGLVPWFRPLDVVTRDDAPAKPDPAGVHYLLRRWRARPGEAVMVGDHDLDMRTARAVGIGAIQLFQRGGHPASPHADVRVGRLLDLLPFIRQSASGRSLWKR
jgi:HAD superfamily hydrolase (TIGR01509 family)